jgi:4-carboxymuconolactone decarboxylase
VKEWCIPLKKPKRRIYRKAQEIGEKLFGAEFTQKRFEGLAEWDEEFAAYFQKFVYGGMYAREVLDPKTRELVAVGALCLLSRTPQLRAHIRAALNCGASLKEIAEVIMQMSVYGGFPVTLYGLDVLKEFIEKEKAK